MKISAVFKILWGSASNLVSLSPYKCFSSSRFPSAEAPSLASSSWAVGRGKPLKENRGERWSRQNFQSYTKV